MFSIGPKIKKLREISGMSQQNLAERLGVPRPAISQIENDERALSAEELKKLSEIFNVSADMILDLEKEPQVILEEDKKMMKKKAVIRINVPQKNLEKFKEILLYILNKVGAKPNVGETVLYKLLYFIDFNFYEKYEEQLIGATYIKNKYGPTPVEFAKIVGKMVKDEEICYLKGKYFDREQKKYHPLKTADITKLKAHEKEIIDNVLERLSDMDANQISQYSHNDVPWLTTADGDKIEYESVFYRTAPYSAR